MANPVIPDAVWAALLASHEQAAQHPSRNAAYDGRAGFMSTTRHGSPAYYPTVSKARNSGSMAVALDREAHLHDRHIPLKDRVKDDNR